MMKAVSFMYVRPPGYNAESAKAAEIADDRKNQEGDSSSQNLPKDGSVNERYFIFILRNYVLIVQMEVQRNVQ